VGLEGISRTQAFTEEKQEVLAKKSPQLVEKQKDLERTVDRMFEKKAELDKQSKLILGYDDELCFMMKEAEQIRNHCDLQLRAAMPIFNDAIEGLMKITKTEINELKTITKPI
jgi:hypothetical protein